MESINALEEESSCRQSLSKAKEKENITVNGRDFKEYFGDETLQYVAIQPLNVLNVASNYDINANIDGGGVRGQSEALRLGIARALVIADPENKKVLKSHGFMTRDPREVERKKSGQPKARKRFQFSKR